VNLAGTASELLGCCRKRPRTTMRSKREAGLRNPPRVGVARCSVEQSQCGTPGRSLVVLRCWRGAQMLALTLFGVLPAFGAPHPPSSHHTPPHQHSGQPPHQHTGGRHGMPHQHTPRSHTPAVHHTPSGHHNTSTTSSASGNHGSSGTTAGHGTSASSTSGNSNHSGAPPALPHLPPHPPPH